MLGCTVARYRPTRHARSAVRSFERRVQACYQKKGQHVVPALCRPIACKKNDGCQRHFWEMRHQQTAASKRVGLPDTFWAAAAKSARALSITITTTEKK